MFEVAVDVDVAHNYSVFLSRRKRRGTFAEQILVWDIWVASGHPDTHTPNACGEAAGRCGVVGWLRGAAGWLVGCGALREATGAAGSVRGGAGGYGGVAGGYGRLRVPPGSGGGRRTPQANSPFPPLGCPKAPWPCPPLGPGWLVERGPGGPQRAISGLPNPPRPIFALSTVHVALFWH